MDGIITSSFGTRINPVLKKEELHDGIDIAVEIGTAVVAVQSGVVIETGKSLTYGNYLKYKTEKGYTIMYAHLSEIKVKENDKVEQRQIVAKSGNSGLTTGAHLHYTIWKNDEYMDSMNYVNLPYTEEVKSEYAHRGEKIS